MGKGVDHLPMPGLPDAQMCTRIFLPPCPQVHQRMKGYVKTHFEHHLKCVERGLIDPYNG